MQSNKSKLNTILLVVLILIAGFIAWKFVDKDKEIDDDAAVVPSGQTQTNQNTQQETVVQNNQNQQPVCDVGYESKPESKIASEQSAALIVGFEKKCDGYYYFTFDYLGPGEGNPEFGGSFYTNTNNKLRTYRIQNGLSVGLSNADSPSYSVDVYINSLRKLNTDILNQNNAYIRNAPSGQPVLNVVVQNGLVVSLGEAYLP